MEYVVAFQTAMMATTAIVTLTFFLLDLIQHALADLVIAKRKCV